MGLMSSNPYFTGNPIAEAINGLRGGFKEGYSGALDRQRQEAELANQQQVRAQQQQLIDIQLQEQMTKQAEAARLQQAQGELQQRVAPRPLVDGNGMPTSLGEGFLPPEFKEQFAGPYANPSQAIQQVRNPEWDNTLAMMQQRKEIPAAPLTTPEIASFGSRMGDKNILEKLIPKDNSDWYNKLYESGKYKPESIEAFKNGTGKLEFSEKSEYKTREYEKGNTKIYEESSDGGRTWKPLSQAPRYKPDSGKSTGGDGKPKGRPMPANTAKALTSAADAADTMDRFAAGFRPEYAGHTIAGGLTTVGGKLFGDNTGHVNFWQDYQGYVNDVRHEKFGAALTPGEKVEFLKYIITERTDPKIAADNLARQKSIVDVALARTSRGYARQYDPETIEEFTGRPIPSADAAKAVPAPYKPPSATGTQPQPKAMTSLPSASEHKGRTVIGSDGIKRRSNGTKWELVR